MSINASHHVSGIPHVENGNVLFQSPINGAYVTPLAINSGGSSGDSSSPVKKEEISMETEPPAMPLPMLSSQLTNSKSNTTTSIVEKAMAGWSLNTAGSVRIGDLYLMVSI